MTGPDLSLELGFELTSRCNRDCRHCFRERSPKPVDLSVELFGRVLQEAKPLSVQRVAFTGGEPTLHPQFSAILEATAAHGYTYHLVTNGHCFPRTFDLMQASGLDHARGVSLSLEGATETTHDSVRGSGSFREVMRAIAVCATQGIRFHVQMTMHRANAHEIEQMARLSAGLGAGRVFFVHLQPTPRTVEAGWAPGAEERLEYESVVRRVAQLVATPVHLSVGHSTRNPLYPCRPLALREVNIDCHGALTFCCQLSNRAGNNGPATDVICCLSGSSLVEACAKLAGRIADVQAARLAYARERAPDDGLYFPCEWCLRYFGKWVEAEQSWESPRTPERCCAALT
ncbi:MAG: radical SAM protein [Armatimonadota bacterium]|jgi:MoaA/NifB/PqqE/SkfB family radical SAM enzyme